MPILPRAIASRLLVVAVAVLCLVVVAHALRPGLAAPATARIAPGVTVHSVRPTQADPAVTGPGSPSLAMAGPRSRSNGMLVVFLPGTGGQPGAASCS